MHLDFMGHRFRYLTPLGNGTAVNGKNNSWKHAVGQPLSPRNYSIDGLRSPPTYREPNLDAQFCVVDWLKWEVSWSHLEIGKGAALFPRGGQSLAKDTSKKISGFLEGIITASGM